MPWVATFSTLGLFAVLLLPLTLTNADGKRENAFIGYKEESGRGKGSGCTDKFKCAWMRSSTFQHHNVCRSSCFLLALLHGCNGRSPSRVYEQHVVL